MFDQPSSVCLLSNVSSCGLARLLTAANRWPAAVLCYVWDPAQPPDSVLPNAYTRRFRWFVLQQPRQRARRVAQRAARLRADFLRAFGDEASELPRIVAVLAGC